MSKPIVKNNNSVLLLTGTINSSGIEFMKRNDTQTRLTDYKKSITKWIRSYDGKIVFVENSNFPRNELGNEICNHKNLEYLSYDGQDFSRNKGKGFGEINSFEYAFLNSKFLKEAENIVKCNGRYFFRNFHKILQFEEDVVGNFRKDLDFMDSRVFGFKPDFFKNFFIKYKNLIDDSKGIYFEHALAIATHELLSTGGKWKSIDFPLIIEGYSGTGNFKYDTPLSNFKIYLKFYIKKLIN